MRLLNYEGIVETPPVRSSSCSTLEECPRKFMYSCRLGIQPKGYSPALLTGSAFHHYMATFSLGKSEAGCKSQVEHMRDQLAKELNDQADSAGMLPGGKDLEATWKAADQDCSKAIAMGTYCARSGIFKPKEWEVLELPDGTPFVELKWTHSSTMYQVPVVAAWDLVMKRRDRTEVWIIDYKTTGSSPLARAKASQISLQTALYRLVLEDCLKEHGIPPSTLRGIVFNIIKKPTIKYCPLTKDSGGFDSYLGRVGKAYKKQCTENPEDPPFLSVYNRFTNSAESAELMGRLQKCAEMSVAPLDLDKFYRAGDRTCHKWNSTCPYLKLCSSDKSLWPDLIKTQFQIAFRNGKDGS